MYKLMNLRRYSESSASQGKWVSCNAAVSTAVHSYFFINDHVDEILLGFIWFAMYHGLRSTVRYRFYDHRDGSAYF